MGSLERSLFKLQAERELGQWAGQFVDPNASLEDDGELFVCVCILNRLMYGMPTILTLPFFFHGL
jgi:hypothetical protein